MKRLLLLLTATCCGLFSYAQLLSWTPPFPTQDNASQTLVITVDATKGNGGLLNHTPTTDVYIHTGVITNLSSSFSDWRYVKFNQNFNQPNAQLQATSLGNNKWQFTITGSLRTYYGVPAGETIQKIAILFRSGDGTKKQANTDGSDMYIPVSTSALEVRLSQPPKQPMFIPMAEPQAWAVGTAFTSSADANKPSQMKLYHNGIIIANSGATQVQTLSGGSSITALGNQQIVAEANDGAITKYDTINIFIAPASSPVAALPAGVRDGINYGTNNTSATLVLRAPGKNIVTVIGEFNNWTQTTSSIMNKTPDGKFFWLTINGLTPGTEYAYQYIVDGTLKIADPYTEKVLDPFNDGFITAATYPNLKPYPAGQSGIVSVLQTSAPAYTWTINNFNRPDKKGLVIYELLVRDFVAAHDWKTIQDSLNYLQKLGVNAIEIMPFNEFEGNNSWGYNPDFYFAADKYYGPANTLKRFIDSCHRRGIAVIMDIALNHSFGQSPMVQMYYDGATNRPAANNPWFNPTPRHAFNVGFDMNHESDDTKYYVGRVTEHWLQQYKIDGFRFDLSKGFTQTQTCDANGGNCNVGTWSNLDASRIAIWKGYYDTVQNKSANAYVILEHFAADNEEVVLSDYGMLLWNNLNHAYTEAAMGYVATSNLDRAVHTIHGFTKQHLITYAESHDEERLMYKSLLFGNNTNAAHNVRDTTIALKRAELASAFLFTIPGPKMIWQFGELGYHYSINTCTNGTVDATGNCRLADKPIRWDFLNDVRRKSVYTTYSKLMALRFHPNYVGAFQSGTIDRSLAGAFKWIKVTTANDTSDVVVIGNFDVTAQTGTVTFPTAGNWYDYFGNFIHTSTGAAQSFTLQPGEFHVYVNRNVNNLTTTPVANVLWNGSTLEAKLYPNPVTTTYVIEVKLPQSGKTVVELYNSVGQYIATLYNGFLTNGTRTLPLSKPNVPAGSYFLKLQLKDKTKTIPFTLQ